MRKYLLLRFVIPTRRGLPPVVIWRGTNPSQAARSRPRAKVWALPTAATRAVAFSTPMPGIVVSRRASASLRARAANSLSNAAIRRSSVSHSARISSINWRTRGPSGASLSPSSIAAKCCSSLRRPCGAVLPRSSKMVRIWLISAVRSPTSRSRARCNDCMSSCSSLLISTKRIVDRVAASTIASASRSSFFCALTYGRTYSGDIRRTV